MFSILNFQEQLKLDLDTVFLNKEAKEFVTTHMIGGIRGKPPVECDVVVDRELYTERTKYKDSVENITRDGLVFFIKTESWTSTFGNVPVIGAAVSFDEKKYLVEAVDDDCGILEITLGANRGMR